MSPLKAIRAYCIECSGGSHHEVRLCTVNHCELYKYRMGKDPNRKQNLTDEQRAERAARLSSYRQNKNQT